LRGPNSLTHNFKIINFKSLVSIDNKQLQEFIQSNDKKLGLRLRSLVSIYNKQIQEFIQSNEYFRVLGFNYKIFNIFFKTVPCNALLVI
jgi:hypothetical protein